MESAAGWIRNLGTQFAVKDLALFLLVNRRLECRLLDVLMRFLTVMGSLPFALALVGGLFLMQSPPLYQLGIKTAGILVTSQILVQAIKRLVNRPRPFKVAEEAHPKNPPSCVYSFPSGHTCAAFSIALALGQGLPGLAVPALITAGLVGLSRVYLGVHYPSDVFVGGLAAFCAWWFLTLI